MRPFATLLAAGALLCAPAPLACEEVGELPYTTVILETAPALAQDEIVLLSVSVTLFNPGDTVTIAAGDGRALGGVAPYGLPTGSFEVFTTAPPEWRTPPVEILLWITDINGKDRALTDEELEGVALIATPAS